jgi:hypothetical protein
MATTTERTCCDSITRNTRISKLKVAALTTLALLAFAGNSVLCRLALADRSIDAASFSTVRLVSGAVALLAILHATNRGAHSPSYGSWMSAAMLFLYAVCFSFAYIGLDTGVGALILFGMVQLTMVAGALIAGDRPTVAEWIGWLLAIAGFVYLVSPGLTAPSPLGSVLMGAAGIAWDGDRHFRNCDQGSAPVCERHRAGRPFRRNNFRGRLRHLVCGAKVDQLDAGRHGAAFRAGACCRGRGSVSGRIRIAAPDRGKSPDSRWNLPCHLRQGEIVER